MILTIKEKNANLHTYKILIKKLTLRMFLMKNILIKKNVNPHKALVNIDHVSLRMVMNP